MAKQANQYGDNLRNTKGEIAELNRVIGRVRNEIESIKGQVRPEPSNTNFKVTNS